MQQICTGATNLSCCPIKIVPEPEKYIPRQAQVNPESNIPCAILPLNIVFSDLI